MISCIFRRGAQEGEFPLSFGGFSHLTPYMNVAVSVHQAREKSRSLSSWMWPRRHAHEVLLLSQHWRMEVLTPLQELGPRSPACSEPLWVGAEGVVRTASGRIVSAGTERQSDTVACPNWERVLWPESQQEVSADREACSTAGLCCKTPDGASEGWSAQ